MIDPVADLLTRIRNAGLAKHESTRVPYSKMKKHVAKILSDEGYIGEYVVNGDGVDKQIIITLRYTERNVLAVRRMKKVSKPGRRVYTGVKDIPRINQGLGIAIVSTSKGVITDGEARRLNVGGEVLCEIW